MQNRFTSLAEFKLQRKKKIVTGLPSKVCWSGTLAWAIMPGPLIDTATSFPSGAKCQLSHVLLNDLGLSVFKSILSNISSSFLLEPRNLVLLIYRSTPDRPTWFAAIPLAALGSDLQTSGFCNCCAVQPGKAWFRTGKIPSVFVH